MIRVLEWDCSIAMMMMMMMVHLEACLFELCLNKNLSSTMPTMMMLMMSIVTLVVPTKLTNLDMCQAMTTIDK
jgi:hypothetical protein